MIKLISPAGKITYLRPRDIRELTSISAEARECLVLTDGGDEYCVQSTAEELNAVLEFMLKDNVLANTTTQVSPESEVLRAGSKLQQIVKNIKRELSTFTSKDALREMMNTREVDDAVVEWDTAMGMATEA